MQSIVWNFPSATPSRISPERPAGLAVAILLHVILAAALLECSVSRPEPIQPPAPLMVSLIAPTSATQDAARPAAEIQPTPPKPKPAKPPSPKPVQSKPKPQAKPAPAPPRRQPVIAAPSDAPSPMSVPASEASSPSASPSAPKAASASAETAEAAHSTPAPITPPRFNADYLDNPAPEYPPLSRSEGEQGKVVLRVFVNASGGAERVEIRKSSGFDRLDEAARATVRRWRFAPARQGGEPVPAWVNVPVAFSLDD